MANFNELSKVVLESSYKGGRRDREIQKYADDTAAKYMKNLEIPADSPKGKTKDNAATLANKAADDNARSAKKANSDYTALKKGYEVDEEDRLKTLKSDKERNEAIKNFRLDETKNPLKKAAIKGEHKLLDKQIDKKSDDAKADNEKFFDNAKKKVIARRHEEVKDQLNKAKVANDAMRSLTGTERKPDIAKENRQKRLHNIELAKQMIKDNKDKDMKKDYTKDVVKGVKSLNARFESASDLKLAIYESCMNGEITAEERDSLLAELI